MAARRSKKKTKAVKKKSRKKAKSDTRKRKARGVGRPRFKPTDEQRQNVEAMVGFGLTFREIASLIRNPETHEGISVNTLQRHFRSELDGGLAKTRAKVANSLVKKAISENHPQAATCAIFYLKCKAGWRQEDKIVHEIEGGTGVLIAPAALTPEEWIRQAQERNEGKKSPADD